MIILVVVTVTLANENGGLFVTTRKAASETQAVAEKETLSAELVGGIKAGGEFDISAVNLPDNMKWCDEGDNDFNSVSKGQPSKGEASWVITKNNNKFYVDAYGNILDDEPKELISFDEAYKKGWVGMEVEGKMIVAYGGKKSNLELSENIEQVPVFKSQEEKNERYETIDLTKENVFITFNGNKDVEKIDFKGIKVKLADWSDPFKACTKLNTITGLEGMTEIIDEAFEGATALTNITIPSSVKKIGGCAFEGCTSLSNITIPSSVIDIGNDAFEGCTNLTQITVNKAENSISGAPWGATNATVTWQE